MRGQKLILVKGVYSLEKWTKPNPLMSTENRPVDISSACTNLIFKLSWDLELSAMPVEVP